MRDFVIFYAQKANALQRRKTLLFRQSSFTKNIVRKTYFRRIVVENSTTKKLKFYRQFQETFNQVFFLIHFCNDKILYIDIDAFKRREFEIMIYYFKSSVDFNNSKRNDIEFILFLNRMLNEIEIRY